MAFTVEQLNSLKPEGFEDEKWKAVTDGVKKLHSEDTNGLVNNEARIKQEKVALSEKLAAITKTAEDSKTAYEEKISGLSKQLADNSPDSIKKAYETKMDELNAALEESKKEFAEKDTNYQKQIAELTHGVFQRDCMDSFEKSIQGKNIDINSIDAVRQLVMGDGFSKFARHEMGGGKSEITSNETGKNISTSVDDFLTTPTGKHFVMSTTTGGGADGGKTSITAGDKKMSVADFDALPENEKMAAALSHDIK
jgi:hypothetical protein